MIGRLGGNEEPHTEVIGYKPVSNVETLQFPTVFSLPIVFRPPLEKVNKAVFPGPFQAFRTQSKRCSWKAEH